MKMSSDLLLGAGAFGAAIYCMILARRLKRFNTLENGVGGAVAVLSAQVDDMTRTLDAARQAAGESSHTLTALTERAEASARKLEIMMASLHDLPDVAPPAHTPPKDEAAQDEAWEAAAAPMFASRREAKAGATR
ncbi:MAG TPA: hypothetical protein ENK63_01480 [Rhodobacterales bacterium]|nr:hypothetical protein [Rhodobacterales bacterium]